MVRPIDTHIPFFFGVITPPSPPSPAPTAPVEALVAALLQAASALPGFVQHDPADHARLLHDTPLGRPKASVAPGRRPRRGEAVKTTAR